MVWHNNHITWNQLGRKNLGGKISNVHDHSVSHLLLGASLSQTNNHLTGDNGVSQVLLVCPGLIQRRGERYHRCDEDCCCIHPVVVCIPEGDAKDLEDVEGGEDLLHHENSKVLEWNHNFIRPIQRSSPRAFRFTKPALVFPQTSKSDSPVQTLNL